MNTGLKLGAGIALALKGLSMSGCAMEEAGPLQLSNEELAQKLESVTRRTVLDPSYLQRAIVGVSGPQGYGSWRRADMLLVAMESKSRSIENEMGETRGGHPERGMAISFELEKPNNQNYSRPTRVAISNAVVWEGSARPEGVPRWTMFENLNLNWGAAGNPEHHNHFRQHVVLLPLRQRHRIGTDEHGMAKLYRADKEEQGTPYMGD